MSASGPAARREADEFRASFAEMTTVVYWTVATILGAVVLLWVAGWLAMPIREVAVLAILLIAHALLVRRVARTTPRPQALFVWLHVVDILAIGIFAYLFGPIGYLLGQLWCMLAVANAAYAGAWCFGLANLGAGTLALMQLGIAVGVLPRYLPPGAEGMPLLLSPAAVISFGVMSWVVLNLLAVHVTRLTRLLAQNRGRLAAANAELEDYREHLEDVVRQRTRELEIANASLDEKASALAERTKRLRTFVYSVTHDLRNPVSAILLIADLLVERLGPRVDLESRADLDRIIRLASSTEDMIRDLLGLFKITSEPETPARVDLTRLAARALDSLGPQVAAKGARIQIDQLPEVWGQETKLAHVLANLLSNAVKYVPAGHGHVRVSGGRENGHVVLAVQDNGIGIPAAYHEGIFNLFGRVPADEQQVDGQEVAGTGVGLAIVKGIVGAHGGSVTVESAPGAGSRFTVVLPAGTSH